MSIVRKTTWRDSDIPDEVFIRWLTFASVLAFFCWVLWQNDLIQSVIRTDPTRISSVIIFIFLCGTAHCARRSAYLSARMREVVAMMQRPETLSLPTGKSRDVRLNAQPLPPSPLVDYLVDIARYRTSPQDDRRISDLNAALVERTTGSHETGWFFAQLLVKLGLLGTVVGFIIMLASISSTISYDAAHVPELFSGMTGGMRVALNTTLVGLVGTILLSFQYLMIDRGADHWLHVTTHFATTQLLNTTAANAPPAAASTGSAGSPQAGSAAGSAQTVASTSSATDTNQTAGERD